MKMTTLAVAICLANFAIVGCCGNKKDPAATQKAAIDQPSGAVAVSAPVNKNCAVMNDHEADKTVTTVHNGKTYAFCCSECIPEFKKNPDKYIAKAK